jgi:hypothetical protein
MTVIATENLSTEIVLHQFRDRLRNVSGPNDADTLTDPKAGSRDSGHPFIVTSFPDTKPLYPMVIVREAGDAGSRPDRRVDLHEHEYDVAVEILTRSSTTYFDLRDSIRGWFEDAIETLAANGFEDGEIVSANRTNWENDVSVVSGGVVFRGTVNTK